MRMQIDLSVEGEPLYIGAVRGHHVNFVLIPVLTLPEGNRFAFGGDWFEYVDTIAVGVEDNPLPIS